MLEGIIQAVCTSSGKGTAKEPRIEVLAKTQWGLDGDAHCGTWHRQVSLLSYDKVEAFRQQGAEVSEGAFGENLLVEGIDLATLPLGTIFMAGSVVLELTQIGKECHSGCDIFKKMGTCIMPTQGVFTRVLHGGVLKPGMLLRAYSKMRVFVLCASDKGYAGTRVDESTPAVCKLAEAAGYELVGTSLLGDDRVQLSAKMAEVCDGYQADLLLTTGGTGLSLRDVTPEATLDIAQRQVPGLSELMRSSCMHITDRACLSRSVCATRERTLIVNLPGSPKAAVENLNAILNPLEHGLLMLSGKSKECATLPSAGEQNS
ncbi:molybdenum cofactor synthesis domain-containing protein [uncultured Sphaerochaeta sp.]|uniref:molybdenum cofactor synthesis domain-containing protein n=1 Tax=uncultured Sphaerochaeta sp. TaxID=886478 RepID=UPI002A0A135C|nr:molybdenum cofactor synthesis domain-containing protein [uncultured Sphaerochaeta sp.]